MKCFLCGEQMECTDDAHSIGIEADYYECPKCHSSAVGEYDDGKLLSVSWKRDSYRMCKKATATSIPRCVMLKQNKTCKYEDWVNCK